MDQTFLVNNDREIGVEVLEALNRAKVPVTLSDWIFVPELDEWQMILAMPWLDSKGVRAAYTALVNTLTGAGIYERVPIRRVVIRSPADPAVEALRRKAKDHRQAVLYVLKHGQRYSVVYPAVTSTGVRDFQDRGQLLRFLSQDVGLRPRVIEDALDQVKRNGVGSIGSLSLSAREAKKLGLI